MRLILLALALIIFAGCGGSSPALVVTPLGTNVRASFNPGAEWSYACTGTATTNANPPEAVSGTLDQQIEVAGIVSPVNGVTARVAAATHDLLIGSGTLLQTVKQYTWADAQGLHWSIGGRDRNGVDWWWADSIDYSTHGIGVGLVDGMVLISLATMDVGDHLAFDYPVVQMVNSALAVVLSDQTGTRRIVGTEVVVTPMGAFECYRVESTLTKNDFGPGTQVTQTITTWERPDMGTVRILSSGANTDGINTVTLDLDCILTHFSP